MGYTWKLALDLHDAVRFAPRSWFWRLHYALWREYRQHSLSRHEGSLTYGETPTSTVVEVLHNLALSPGQRILDLGSGRGLPSLVAASLGYQAVGLEYFPEHVERSERVARRLGLTARFEACDFLCQPWPDTEACFLCSTAFTPDLRESLQDRLASQPPGTWVVTQDWELGDGFELVRKQRLPVTWGTALFRYYRIKA